MQNNNLAPDMMLASGNIVASDYLSYIFNLEPGFTNARGRRSIELLAGLENASVQEFMKVGFDTKWIIVEPLQQVLLEQLKQDATIVSSLDDNERRFLEQILAFDGYAEAQSVEALSFLYWFIKVANLEMAAKINGPALLQNAYAGISLSAAEKEHILNGISAAVDTQLRHFGTIDKKLGDVVTVGRGETKLPVGGFGLPMGWSSLRMMLCNPALLLGKGECDVSYGQAHPMLTVFSDPIESYSAVPWGQSNLATSPHHSDQSILASEKRMKSTYFNWSELKDHIESVTSVSRETK